MTTKSLLLAGTLALATLSFASAKSYDIVLTSPAQAGKTQLNKGEYRLKVDGNVATFTDVETVKTYTAPVKIESAPKKFDLTAVDTDSQSGTEKIQSIELGGSTTKLEFGE